MRVVHVRNVKRGLLDAVWSTSGHVRMGRGYWAAPASKYAELSLTE